jgi:putative phage-type endonuclease
VKLTSSNFAAAIGLNPYQSRQKLFKILTGRASRDPLNAAMKWGIDNEKRAVAGVEAITGLLFEYTGENQMHSTFHDYGTTPDGCQVGRNIGLEVKCPSNMYQEIPVYYMPQVQGQMMVAHFDAVYFSPWTPEEQKVWLVPRDDRYIEWMHELLSDFMKCLERDEEPKRRKKPTPPEVNYEEIL